MCPKFHNSYLTPNKDLAIVPHYSPFEAILTLVPVFSFLAVNRSLKNL